MNITENDEQKNLPELWSFEFVSLTEQRIERLPKSIPIGSESRNSECTDILGKKSTINI